MREHRPKQVGVSATVRKRRGALIRRHLHYSWAKPYHVWGRGGKPELPARLLQTDLSNTEETRGGKPKTDKMGGGLREEETFTKTVIGNSTYSQKVVGQDL